MGDPNRFHYFADLIHRLIPRADRVKVADVAGGVGRLGRALRLLGYRAITIDHRVRINNARWRRLRQSFRYNTPEHFDLVVGMHPDEATDHIILYARRQRVPFVVCPCCIKPDAAPYPGNPSDKRAWIRHLIGLAGGGVSLVRLPIEGDNLVLYKLTW